MAITIRIMIKREYYEHIVFLFQKFKIIIQSIGHTILAQINLMTGIIVWIVLYIVQTLKGNISCKPCLDYATIT